MAPRPRQLQQHAASATSFGWTEAEALLQELADSNCQHEQWSTCMQRVVPFQHLQESAQRWPTWFLAKLAAAVTRGLHRDILGLGGTAPRADCLLTPNSVETAAAKSEVVNILCTLGELLQMLSDVLRTSLRGSRPAPGRLSASNLEQLVEESGLMAGIGSAAGDLAAFLDRTGLLMPKPKVAEPMQQHTQETAAYVMTSLSVALINIFRIILPHLPNGDFLVDASPSVFRSFSQLINLSAAVLRSFPGPPPRPFDQDLVRAIGVEAPRNALGAAAAAAAAAQAEETRRQMLQGGPVPPAGQLAAEWQYKQNAIRMALDTAAALMTAVCQEVWSSAMGSPTSALMPSTPQPVLKLLASPDAQLLLLTNLVLLATWLHHDQKGKRAISAAAQQQQQPQQQDPQKQQKPRSKQRRRQEQKGGDESVEPWHEQLATALGLNGADLLPYRTVHDIPGARSTTLLMFPVVAIMCSLAAHMATEHHAQSLGPLTERSYSEAAPGGYFPEGVTEPVVKTLVEVMLLHEDWAAGSFALQLVQAIVSSPGVRTGEDVAPSKLVQPVLGVMLPRVLQLVQQADSNNGWAALEEKGLPAQSIRGSMLEGMCNMAIALVLSRGAMDVIAELSNSITASPTVMLPALEAVVRLRGVADATNKVFSRRLQLSIPGIQAPDLLMICPEIIMCATAEACALPSDVLISVFEDPTGAGSAWLGLMFSISKYATWAFNDAPAVNSWDVLAVTTAQLLAAHVVVTASVPLEMPARNSTELMFCWPMEETVIAQAAASGKPVPEAETLVCGEEAARELGPLLLPLVLLSARCLLLLSKVLLLPAGRGSSRGLEQQGKLMQYRPETLVTACTNTIDALEQLLPCVSWKPITPAASAGSSSSNRPGSSTVAAAEPGQEKLSLPADVLAALHEKVVSLRLQLKAAAAACQSQPKRAADERWSAQQLLAAAKTVFNATSSSSNSSSSGQSDKSGLPLQLQEFAEVLLTQLPASKVCANPSCMQLDKLSERELSIKKCSACKVSYCSLQCSKRHWPQHKLYCKKLSAGTGAGSKAASSSSGKQK